MTAHSYIGRIQNGLVIPDEPVDLPDGTKVRIEVINATPEKLKRQGGVWNGQVVIADDFDTLILSRTVKLTLSVAVANWKRTRIG